MSLSLLRGLWPTSPVGRLSARVLSGLLALISVLLGLSWLLVPRLADEVARQASQALGRPVQLSALHWAPWRLALTLEGVAVGGVGPDAPPLLTVRSMEIDASLSSLWRVAPVIESVRIVQPHLRVARLAPGRYDVDDLWQRLATPSPTAPAEAGPFRMALHDLQVEEGKVDFDDRPVQRRHSVTDLSLALPVLSTLDETALQAALAPRLSMTVDGSPLRADAQARVLGTVPSGEWGLSLSGLDLAAWRAYLPTGLHWRPVAGTLALELRAAFDAPPQGRPGLNLKGWVEVSDLRLERPDGQPLLQLPSMRVDIAALDPLRQQVHLSGWRLQDGRWWLSQGRDGRLNWQAPVTSAAAAPAADAPSPWQVQLDHLEATGHTLDWQDGEGRLSARAVALDVRALKWPLSQALQARVSAGLPAARQGSADGALNVEGALGPEGAQGRVHLESLDLAVLQPWLKPWLALQVQGRASLDGAWGWREGLALRAPTLHLDQAAIESLSLRTPRGGDTPLLWGALKARDVDVALEPRTLRVAGLDSQGLVLRVGRDAEGRLSLSDWLPSSAPAKPVPAVAPEPGPAWQARVDRLGVQGARLRWQDDRRPVVAVSDLGMQLQGLAWPLGRGAAWTWSGSARVGAEASGRAARAAEGRLQWQGRLDPLSPAWSGQLSAERLPLHLAAPYLAEALPLELQRAELDWRGPLQLSASAQGWQVRLKGDARLAELHLAGRAGSPTAGEELLSWRALDLRGLDLAMQPATTPRLALDRVTLADFYASLVVTEQGELNLNEWRGASSASPVAALAPGPDGATEAPPPQAAGVSPPSAAASSAWSLVLGGAELVNGRVDFADRFVRPNYSAALSALEGRLGPYRSDADAMAELSLTGRVAGTGHLSLSGGLRPGAQPPVLDLRAQARDIELSPLSPYAGKYAGYGIERGKLAVDLRYRIEPDGRLQARNQLVLQQLTFGEAVDSPDATRLPVRLAVALLQDRHGVIDLDLPVGGSVNDPQFSVGGLVLKILVNLLAKAVTAPFALLSGGGDTDLGQVAFVPGTARLAEASEASLERVAGTLRDRESLQLSITGVVDPATEEAEVRAARLASRLDGLARSRGLDEAGVASMSTEERDALLARLYRDAPLPDKPRNLVGLVKELSPGEMRLRLLAAMSPDPSAWRQLAQQRAQAVRDALLARGVPNERMFLTAERLEVETGRAAGAWLGLEHH
jgi:uncharacterized protein involved in outer membrane biogenesis